MANCPECEFDELDSSDLEEGDTVNCPECGSSLAMSATGELEFATDDDDDDDKDDKDDKDDEDKDDDDDEDEVADDEDE